MVVMILCTKVVALATWIPSTSSSICSSVWYLRNLPRHTTFHHHEHVVGFFCCPLARPDYEKAFQRIENSWSLFVRIFLASYIQSHFVLRNQEVSLRELLHRVIIILFSGSHLTRFNFFAIFSRPISDGWVWGWGGWVGIWIIFEGEMEKEIWRYEWSWWS